LSTRFAATADWSATHHASLSAASRGVLRSLDGPVEVVAYARPGNAQRARIRAFVERYQRIKPDLQLRFVDPEQDPAGTRAAGITVNGELVVHYRKRQRFVRKVDERHLTNALEGLARGGDQLVAFVTG